MSPTRIFPAIALLALAAQAHATEGGASIYPHGVEGFMAGALPPPCAPWVWPVRSPTAA